MLLYSNAKVTIYKTFIILKEIEFGIVIGNVTKNINLLIVKRYNIDEHLFIDSYNTCTIVNDFNCSQISSYI